MTNRKLICQFIPQVWQGKRDDYALCVDPLGPDEWEMDMAEVEHLTGVTDLDRLDDDPFARDELRFSKTAPDWVKNWTGPFEINLLDSYEEEDA